MPAAAVAVDEHRSGTIERGRIFGPAIGVNYGADPVNLVEALFQEQATSPEFVLAGTMADGSRNEHNLFLSSAGRGGERQRRRQDDQLQGSLHFSLLAVQVPSYSFKVTLPFILSL